VGSGFPLGGFRAYPWLNLLMSYETNYYRSNDDIDRLGGLGVLSTWESVLEPGIRLNALRGADSYNLSYLARIGNVFSSSEDDFFDQQAVATANWDLGLRHRASLDYQYWNWHDRRGTGSPVDSSRANFSEEPDRWVSNRVTGGYSYGAPGARGRVDLLAGFRTRNYINNNQGYRDNDRTVLGATFFARVRPKVSLLLELGWEGIDYTDQQPDTLSLDSDQTIAYGGVTWDATGKTTGTVKLGWMTKDFSAQQREDVSDMGWSAQVQWRPRTYSTVNLVTERAPVETSTGGADAVVVSSLRLDWVHYWRPLVYTRFGLLGTDDDYIGESRVDHRYGASGGVFYQMRRWLELGVDYSYESRTSDESLAEYTNNIVLFSFRTVY
jgi:polysaccharide biosynthesis protein VpsM